MSKKQVMKIDDLNVWANCKIQVINEETMKYETIAEVPYTPKHIKQAMKKNNVKSAWIYFMGERTYQFIEKVSAR